MAQHPLVCQGLVVIEASRSHSYTTTWQNTTPTTDTRDSGGIRNRNPSSRAATDPHLRPNDHWVRLSGRCKASKLNGRQETCFLSIRIKNAYWHQT